MTKDMIGSAINREYPGVYAPTTAPVTLIFRDLVMKVGYFERMKPDMGEFDADNKYSFIEFKNRNEKDPYTIIDGDELTAVEYPSNEKQNAIETVFN